MRLNILLFTVFLFFTVHTKAQNNVTKTITFNSVTLPAGSCYLVGDVDGGADFAILVDCNFGNGSQIFAGDWPEGEPLDDGASTYDLGPIYSGFPGFSCPADNMVFGPIDASTTTLAVTIEAFESDESNCTGPYDGVDTGDGVDDDCYGGITNVSLSITNGSHSFTVGAGANQITYNYTVTSAATNTSGSICGQNLAASAPNDLCGGATALPTDMTVITGSSSFTSDSDAPDISSCSGDTNNEGVWFTLLGDGGNVTINTDNANTDFDTALSVFTSTGGCGGTLTCIAYDNDSGANNTSVVSFRSQNGTTYYVYLNDNGVDGSYGISAESVASVPTLSQWGLIILALLLMTAGTLYLVQPNITTKEA